VRAGLSGGVHAARAPEVAGAAVPAALRRETAGTVDDMPGVSRDGERSREAILDAAERLMASGGYAATSIADIRVSSGLPASSIYWHFGSKQGLLAAVLERGAQRWFGAIPTWDEVEVPEEDKLDAMMKVWAQALRQEPEFMRLSFMLSLEDTDDPKVAAIVREVRDAAIARFREGVRRLIPPGVEPRRAERATAEMTTMLVALSDGFFFAAHLEPDTTDLDRLCQLAGRVIESLLPRLLTE
jgi:AcrR family transcriptional regulator